MCAFIHFLSLRLFDQESSINKWQEINSYYIFHGFGHKREMEISYSQICECFMQQFFDFINRLKMLNIQQIESKPRDLDI